MIIRGGRVVDPASGRDEIADVWIENGRVAALGRLECEFDGLSWRTGGGNRQVVAAAQRVAQAPDDSSVAPPSGQA